MLGEDAEVLARIRAASWRARPTSGRSSSSSSRPTPDAHYVVLADYVTTEDGTGLVHQAPAFGADDLAVCPAYGLPVVNPIGPDGHFHAGRAAGRRHVLQGRRRRRWWPTCATAACCSGTCPTSTPIRTAGAATRRSCTTRCRPGTSARPRSRTSCSPRTRRTNWYPATIKHGRYGDWLNNNIDWALSRDRYWGTPLPIWRNDADPTRLVCVGSLAELRELSGGDLPTSTRTGRSSTTSTFTLPGEDGTYRRVPEVIDGWYDSGSMPFAQWGAPHRNDEEAEAAYPADFICEAIDQTRGWFYTLMAIGTLVFDQCSYETVLCLGHILAEDGRKMSKHLGNILDPIPLMDRHGADAVRWFMLCAGSPWSARRVGHKVLEEIASRCC